MTIDALKTQKTRAIKAFLGIALAAIASATNPAQAYADVDPTRIESGVGLDAIRERRGEAPVDAEESVEKAPVEVKENGTEPEVALSSDELEFRKDILRRSHQMNMYGSSAAQTGSDEKTPGSTEVGVNHLGEELAAEEQQLSKRLNYASTEDDRNTILNNAAAEVDTDVAFLFGDGVIEGRTSEDVTDEDRALILAHISNVLNISCNVDPDFDSRLSAFSQAAITQLDEAIGMSNEDCKNYGEQVKASLGSQKTN